MGGKLFSEQLEEFKWKETPKKDVSIPQKAEWQRYLDTLNKALKEAEVKDKTFKMPDNGILTAQYYNDIKNYIQDEHEDTLLKGVDEEDCKHQPDVKKDDIVTASHFQKLEDLYNNWRYGADFCGSPNEMEVYEFLAKKPFMTDVVRAALMGFMWGESQLNPTVHEIGGGGGFGLCQWTPPATKARLRSFCASRGLDYNSIQGQMEFLMYEIYDPCYDNTWSNYLKYGCHDPICGGNHKPTGTLDDYFQLTDLYEAVYQITWWYGRPNASVPRIQERYAAAQMYLRRMQEGCSGGVGTGDCVIPCNYRMITGEFGCHSGAYVGGCHRAIDLAGPQGTFLYAIDGGTIVDNSYHPSWGNNLVIDHGTGLFTRYAHMASLSPLSVGTPVSKMGLVGYMGSTGNSTGPHLHIEFMLGSSYGTLVNPRYYINFPPSFYGYPGPK